MLFLSQNWLLFDGLWKQMLLLSSFICLLHQIPWHATVDGNVTGEERYLSNSGNNSW